MVLRLGEVSFRRPESNLAVFESKFFGWGIWQAERRPSNHGRRSPPASAARSEQIAVALVLNKPALFPHGGYTILEAVDRLGPDWTAAALKAQRLLDTDQ